MDINFWETSENEILDLANTDAGKFLLGAKSKNPIVKVTSNSYHELIFSDNKTAIVTGYFCTSSKSNQAFLSAITKMDIAKEEYKIINNYEAFLHFSDLQPRDYKYPQIYLTDFNVGSGDGYVRNDSTVNYATARNAGTGNVANGTATLSDFTSPGQAYSGGKYYVGRVFLPTDTSSIPDTDVISSGSVNFFPTGVRNVDSDSVVFVSTNQASTSTLALDDFDTAGSVSGGDLPLASITANTMTAVTLNATGLGFINKSGISKVGLRSLQDINSSAPTGDANDFYPGICFSEHATSAQRPYLSLTYAAETTTNLGGSRNLLGVGI